MDTFKGQTFLKLNSHCIEMVTDRICWRNIKYYTCWTKLKMGQLFINPPIMKIKNRIIKHWVILTDCIDQEEKYTWFGSSLQLQTTKETNTQTCLRLDGLWKANVIWKTDCYMGLRNIMQVGWYETFYRPSLWLMKWTIHGKRKTWQRRSHADVQVMLGIGLSYFISFHYQLQFVTFT